MGVAADAPPPGPLQATLGFDIIPGPTRASSCSGPDNPAHDAQKWSLARPRCPVCDRGLVRCFRGKLEPEPIAPLGLASSLLPVLHQSQEEGGTDQAGCSAVTYRHATDVRSPSEVKKKRKENLEILSSSDFFPPKLLSLLRNPNFRWNLLQEPRAAIVARGPKPSSPDVDFLPDACKGISAMPSPQEAGGKSLYLIRLHPLVEKTVARRST